VQITPGFPIGVGNDNEEPPHNDKIFMLKIKKYIYLINDLTSALLKKERVDFETRNKRLKIILIIASISLILSISLNIILILKYL